jgi:outer membrane receptor protein involved in Fe transport
MNTIRVAALLTAMPLVTIGWAAAAPPAFGQAAAPLRLRLPAGPLAASLRAVARASGRSIAAPADLVAGKTAPALNGEFTVDTALDLLLAGTGLRARAVGDGLIIERDPSDTASAAPGPEIVVTGSRIRGGKIASPVITIGREEARDRGQATLGEIVRSIPQSFGGGQNPGIGFNVPTASGVDSGGASSINLRGLGSDATLTLLDGHRLAYGGTRQSVDVSTIPLGALERIEIVADGASALYGSDAVGGVANIILRRDMEGVETRARIGGATRGGDFQQQYDLTAGARWVSGGVIAAYEYNDASAIDAHQRDYAAVRANGLRLLPSARNHNGLLSTHQQLGDALEFSLDALYNDRRTFFRYSLDPAGDLASRVEQRTDEAAFAIAPKLSLTAGAWRLALSGSYAEDRVDYKSVVVTPAVSFLAAAGCYCNSAAAIELSGDGRLFALPAGPVKLAVGLGYRTIGLKSDRGSGNFQNFDASQASAYGYGELDIPVLGAPGPRTSGMRLDLTAAGRYEHYRTFGSVATPKFGVIWSPHPAIDLKASWGKSFRAPTLLQLFQPNIATLYPAASLGGAGLPAGATALYVQGGRPGLKPERATTWSLTAKLHPLAWPGFDLELSYFSVNYVDRIVAPISFLSQSLSNPIYAAQITRNPSAAMVQAIVAGAGFFQQSAGAVYDPATVAALVDNSNVNAGRQPAHGLDALLSYSTALGPRDRLNLSANASYLASSRQISTAQPVVPLAGTLFNPPHWRAQGSLGWQHGEFGVTTTLSYMGPLRDPRSTPALRIPGQTTLDLALRYRSPASAPAALRGLDLTLSVQNLFDRPPPLIATSFVTDTPYDSTNYSPIGRFISVSIAKKW